MKKLLLTLSLVIFGLTAAQQQQDPAVAAEGDYALVRVAHLSPNAPAVNIVLLAEAGVIAEGQVTAAQLDELEGLEYEQVSNYVAIRAGDYRVQITTEDDTLVYETNVNFGANNYYTVAAIGFVIEGEDGEVQPVIEEDTAEGNGFFGWLEGLFGDDEEAQQELTIRLHVFDDEPGTFPAAGYAHVRVIHASAGSPDIDLVWTRGAAPATAQQPATAEQQQEDMGALEVTVEPADAIVSIVGPDGYEDTFQGSQTFSNLPAGSYVVSATREGYEPASEEVEVEEGETATVELTLDEAEGEEAAELREQEQPMVEQPAVTDPAAPADPAVTEPAADEEVVVSGLGYGDASGYEAVWAMTEPFLQVRSADGNGQTILLDLDDADIRPGHVYTIFVTGTTFEDYAIGYVRVIDSMLGGGTEIVEDEEMVEDEEPEEEEEEVEDDEPETEEEEDTEEDGN
jgi:hypothetical protein